MSGFRRGGGGGGRRGVRGGAPMGRGIGTDVPLHHVENPLPFVPTGYAYHQANLGTNGAQQMNPSQTPIPGFNTGVQRQSPSYSVPPPQQLQHSYQSNNTQHQQQRYNNNPSYSGRSDGSAYHSHHPQQNSPFSPHQNTSNNNHNNNGYETYGGSYTSNHPSSHFSVQHHQPRQNSNEQTEKIPPTLSVGHLPMPPVPVGKTPPGQASYDDQITKLPQQFQQQHMQHFSHPHNIGSSHLHHPNPGGLTLPSISIGATAVTVSMTNPQPISVSVGSFPNNSNMSFPQSHAQQQHQGNSNFNNSLTGPPPSDSQIRAPTFTDYSGSGTGPKDSPAWARLAATLHQFFPCDTSANFLDAILLLQDRDPEVPVLINPTFTAWVEENYRDRPVRVAVDADYFLDLVLRLVQDSDPTWILVHTLPPQLKSVLRRTIQEIFTNKNMVPIFVFNGCPPSGTIISPHAAEEQLDHQDLVWNLVDAWQRHSDRHRHTQTPPLMSAETIMGAYGSTRWSAITVGEDVEAQIMFLLQELGVECIRAPYLNWAQMVAMTVRNDASPGHVDELFGPPEIICIPGVERVLIAVEPKAHVSDMDSLDGSEPAVVIVNKNAVLEALFSKKDLQPTVIGTVLPNTPPPKFIDPFSALSVEEKNTALIDFTLLVSSHPALTLLQSDILEKSEWYDNVSDFLQTFRARTVVVDAPGRAKMTQPRGPGSASYSAPYYSISVLLTRLVVDVTTQAFKDGDNAALEEGPRLTAVRDEKMRILKGRTFLAHNMVFPPSWWKAQSMDLIPLSQILDGAASIPQRLHSVFGFKLPLPLYLLHASGVLPTATLQFLSQQHYIEHPPVSDSFVLRNVVSVLAGLRNQTLDVVVRKLERNTGYRDKVNFRSIRWFHPIKKELTRPESGVVLTEWAVSDAAEILEGFVPASEFSKSAKNDRGEPLVPVTLSSVMPLCSLSTETVPTYLSPRDVLVATHLKTLDMLGYFGYGGFYLGSPEQSGQAVSLRSYITNRSSINLSQSATEQAVALTSGTTTQSSFTHGQKDYHLQSQSAGNSNLTKSEAGTSATLSPKARHIKSATDSCEGFPMESLVVCVEMYLTAALTADVIIPVSSGNTRDTLPGYIHHIEGKEPPAPHRFACRLATLFPLVFEGPRRSPFKAREDDSSPSTPQNHTTPHSRCSEETDMSHLVYATAKKPGVHIDPILAEYPSLLLANRDLVTFVCIARYFRNILRCTAELHLASIILEGSCKCPDITTAQIMARSLPFGSTGSHQAVCSSASPLCSVGGSLMKFMLETEDSELLQQGLDVLSRNNWRKANVETQPKELQAMCRVAAMMERFPFLAWVAQPIRNIHPGSFTSPITPPDIDFALPKEPKEGLSAESAEEANLSPEVQNAASVIAGVLHFVWVTCEVLRNLSEDIDFEFDRQYQTEIKAVALETQARVEKCQLLYRLSRRQ